MYPEINTIVDELHKRRISTFLVTNAQFPEKIKSLRPITQVFAEPFIIPFSTNTAKSRIPIGFSLQPRSLLYFLYAQLYVSVDAATKDSLKAIDRPLFSDFWERFVVSVFLLLLLKVTIPSSKCFESINAGISFFVYYQNLQCFESASASYHDGINLR